MMLGSTGVEATEFTGSDLCAVRDLVAGGQIVLLRDEVPADSHTDQWPQDIVESVGECAAVPLSILTGAGGPRYPLVIGPRESIRYLCSYADRMPPPPFPYEARPVVTDYREFRDLWVAEPGRFTPDTDGYAIGHALALLHSRNILHGDAHRGNWLFDREGRALAADPKPVFLRCPPSPEQCATDIRPLLPALDSNGWMSFRLSYRRTWPEEGRVIDLIQLTDRTGWAAAFRTRDYQRAAELMGRQLTGECTPIVRVMLLANRAIARSRTGRHDDAWRDIADAARLAQERSPHVASGLAIAVAVVSADQGDRSVALHALSMVTGQPEQLLTRLEPSDAQLPIMNM
ncbi:hypothetical protein [Micromonospora sp. NPDC000442]|uniref:hypothetical protein n=1 Tax=Micromonospora sp. NPDC000442 TaxID=3364217 RepID=UPI0036BD2AE6